MRAVRYVPTGLLGLAALALVAALLLRHDVLRRHGAALEAAVVYRPPGSVQVFARDGSLLDTHWQERRFWVALTDLPPHVSAAVVAAEDRRFFAHGGVDLLGVLRAIVANAMGGRVVQGGSTLTQQLVKNHVVGDARTLGRKVDEAILALELERRLPKDRILELYLNDVYLGARNHGVEAAARDVFGVSAADLSPAQAATLATAIPAPSRLEPRRDPTRTRTRRDRVLRAMAADGHLDDAALREALATPLRMRRTGQGTAATGHGAAYATVVRRQLERTLGDAPFAEGMQVQTALEPTIQAVAQAAVADAAAAVEARQGRYAIRTHLATADARDAFLARAPDLSPGDCFDALLTGRSTLATAPDRTWTLAPGERAHRVRQRDREEGPSAPFGAVARRHDVVRVCAVDDRTVRLDDRPWVQGAAVVIEHATGEVVALVGGVTPELEGFVRATQARRQPGSTFKTVVLATAIEAGWSQTSVVRDAPIALPAGDGTVWRPTNAGGYRGPVALRTALAASLNTVAVRLTRELGAGTVVDTARRMGVRTPIRPVPSVALGAAEVTPLDLAVATATIANGGMAREARFIRRVDDREGVVLGAAGGPVRVGTEALARLPGRVARALSAGTAFEVADAMAAVVAEGTGRAASRPDRWRAGKTGTTSGATDTWFTGFTPRYTITVWIGADEGGSLGAGESGARTALPAWIAIADAVPSAPDEVLRMPEGARWIRWNGRRIAQRRPGF